MAEARAQASLAAQMGEVPVGAVMLFEGRILAKAHNRREIDRDPLAHAEMLVLREAAQVLDRWRLTGCTLVVTLEPCPMCAGAVVNSRVDHVVFGAWDARAGAVGSLCNIVEDARLNHRAKVTAGVEAELCRVQLRQFFAARRQDNKRSGL